MDPRTDLLPVVQSDRDRAAERHSAYMRGSLAWMHERPQCARMLKGAWDEHPTVQAFAAHRLAHTPETQIGRDGLVEEWNTLMDSTSMLSFNTEVAAWARKNVPALLAADHPNVLDEVERVANVKRELAERARNMMGLLADLRASVDLDDDSSEGVLGYCDDLETAVHNIAAVASHLPGAAIPADPLRARLVEALTKAAQLDPATASDRQWNDLYCAVLNLLAELTPESE